MQTNNQKEYFFGISEFQLYLFNEGTNFKSYEMLGAHPVQIDKDGEKISGWRFAVWAPNAKSVHLVGDFNNWCGFDRPLHKIGTTGVWCGFFADIEEYSLYKYAIKTQDSRLVLKADPYAFSSELRPNSASVTRDISRFKWSDGAWLAKRAKKPPYSSPMLIYELHTGSWRTHENGDFYTYRELADSLVPYVREMGYTHIELMPLTEYPFDGSWGYQVTGFFSATSRYGSPEDLKYFINHCHKNGIAVIMDWVPAHFPKDAHGLAKFDGTCCYEYADTRIGEHKEWGTLVFDYTKTEVISFLTSSAYFWAQEYHVDGFRVDAVSSMLYRDYGRQNGQWLPNKYGGHQNIEAIEFLRSLNKIMFANFPNILMIAEESTSWGMVTAPAHEGGLGFNYKWNMGWMNDTLRYMSMDPLFRKPNHNLLTFLMLYAFSENFILPLSHDEVVHGKKSLIDKMFGSYEEKFASLRTLFAYFMSIPGKKLLFMGGEFGQFIEWRYNESLQWQLLEFDMHRKLHEFVKDLNHFYLENKSFWQIEDSWDGFSWINPEDAENSVLSYIRKGRAKGDFVVVVLNFTPVARRRYTLGVPSSGEYEIVLCSDSKKYGGATKAASKSYKAKKGEKNGMPYHICLTLPGLSAVYLKKKKNVPALPKKKQKVLQQADIQ
ncbi:MAG: 1,4-alpha-glucan branching protein GlgB [Clostridia bacterium]|nr:1,4-alpha-glucan branching protein GlgB [Clostridia bacterium]